MAFHILVDLHNDLQICNLYGKKIALFTIIILHTKSTI